MLRRNTIKRVSILTRIGILLFFIGFIMNVTAQTRLPNFFSDGMVLQQQAEVKVWGWDNAQTQVTVHTTWGEKKVGTSDVNGRWEVRLNTPAAKAGLVHELAINGTKQIKINQVRLGEVWLASGQSNMAMALGADRDTISGGKEAIRNSGKENIHFFIVDLNTSPEPLSDVSGKWQAASPKHSGRFSAAAYFFAQKLYEKLKVPIGIMQSAKGGSRVEAWMDGITLSNHLPINYDDQEYNVPSCLYNGMLHPLEGYELKGMIWYQGERNRWYPDEYAKLFPDFLNMVRDKWEQTLPFYYVEIAPYEYSLPKDTVNSARIREVQYTSLANMDKVGMVSTIDVGDCGNLHPPNKKDIGLRLANWALKDTYAIGEMAVSGPTYKDMVIDRATQSITINFENTYGGLSSFDKPLDGFEISGNDRVFYPATATINGKGSVTVRSQSVSDPIAVRYAFTHCPKATLFNLAGLPASSFRTDKWERLQ